ncbi:MAG: TIGR02099 family protein [Betaproteobacteria bacterium]|nr:TIGR02099 family protein [Betaproteobacteria bacterium]
MFLKYCFAFLKHGSLWTYRAATYAVLIAGLVFVALVLGLRYLVLPNIDDYREPIARTIARSVGQRVTIGSITGSWQGYRPELNLMDVKVFGTDGQPALVLDRVETVLSWLSLLSAEWRFDSLAVYGPELEVKRDASGVLWVAGIAMQRQAADGGGFSEWLLAQRQVLVRDATITWLDEMRSAPELRLDKVNFRLDRDGAIHRFGLTAVPPAQIASPLVARGEFLGRDVREVQLWNGKLYAEIGYADLALAQVWIPAPLELASGLGSLRLWLELNGTRLGAATADLRLVNVQTRLASNLPDLVLSEVEGRLGWMQRGDRTEISATSFGFTAADGLKLAPTQFSYARSEPAGGVRHSELHLSGLDLAPVVDLAEFLPLDAALRGRLARSAPTGTVEDANFSWDGDWGTGHPYSAKVRFAAMAARPDGSLPGFHGLSGQFDANERGGTISLKATNGGVELPKIFSEPLPLDYLAANAGWTFHDDVVDLAIKNANFTNEHLAGSVSGSYRNAAEGRGSVDLSGMLVRADAHQLWRYMPVAAPVTQAWLKRALLAGESKDMRFRLKGPLKDFPFAGDKNGVFEVATKASGVTIDYADGWPPITGITGDVVFRGDRMDLRGQSGAILGLQLSGVRASIAELGRHNEHLQVKGVAQGATSDFLRYAASTPVAGHINRFTDEMKAAGDAKLDLELDLPLHQIKESAVKGVLMLQNNLVTLDPRLPPFEHFGARIAFTEHSFNVREGRALMFGEPLSFEASNQAVGGITASIVGTLDVDQARVVWKHPMLAFLDGQTPWRGTIVVRNKIATIRFDSNLVGLTSTLPPPFAKAASASLPLRVELRERPGRQGVLAVNLDKVASAQLLLDGGAPGGVSRGMVSLGSPAALPTSDGLWLRGSLDLVDADVWQGLLSGGPGDSQIDLAGVDLQIGILDVGRRRFHGLKVEATRQAAGWQATLAGREVAGQMSWVSDGDGKLAARLSKLVLPPITTEIQAGKPGGGAEQRLPSVDLVADSFTYEGKDLGRLTVLAQPETSGWQLQRLEIANPESKFAMSGRWAIGEISRTDVKVKLEVSDVGKFFTRLGWPDSVQGGTALLEGPIAWRGNPTRFDIPSLSGQLKLEAKGGRFRQIEPGVAKLLGILSLQALPRRVSLDFRDVFSKGFSFDRISANLNITAGVAYTQDFRMEGSAARVAMHGQVDLARETQNLIVRVTPSLSESIAIAGAIVNPAIGVAALIAQKALKDPFSQIASFDYSVTGSWADPVIARVSKSPSDVKEKGR